MAQNGKAPYKHKPNHGSMFENDRKKTDKHPDFTGSVDVDGTVYWMSAWKDKTQSGKRKLSIALTLQEERPQGRGTQRPAPRGGDDW